jgi:ABC-type multidrug transport system fused ATPase/permease subunit
MFWILFIGGMLLCDTIFAVQTWFMGYWAEQYNIYPPEQVNITLQVFRNFGQFFLLMAVGLTFASYLTVYGFMLLAIVVSYTMGFGVYVFGALRASRSIHQKLIESVLGTTLRCVSIFLDTGQCCELLFFVGGWTRPQHPESSLASRRTSALVRFSTTLGRNAQISQFPFSSGRPSLQLI